MKNKIIRFDDRLYLTFFSFSISMLSLLVLIFEIDVMPLWGFTVLSIVFSLFLAGVFVFPKIGIRIYYKHGVIKYLGHAKINSPVIKIKNINNISFIEIPKERKKMFTDYSITSIGHDGFLSEPKHVYRNGKIFKFIIKLKDGNELTIPYYNLFKSWSRRRVYKQEAHIKKIIEELNHYLENQLNL